MAMVVGANIGSALNPVLEGDRSEWARLRVPLGNLANRLVGGVIVLAALPWASEAMLCWTRRRRVSSPMRILPSTSSSPSWRRRAALLGLRPCWNGCCRKPRRRRSPPRRATSTNPRCGPRRSRWPAAEREALRQADALEEMLRTVATGFRTEDRDLGKRVALAERGGGPAGPRRAGLSRRARPGIAGAGEQRRVAEIRAFVLHLESAGDVLDRSLARVAAKWAKEGVSDDGMMDAIQAMMCAASNSCSSPSPPSCARTSPPPAS